LLNANVLQRWLSNATALRWHFRRSPSVPRCGYLACGLPFIDSVGHAPFGAELDNRGMVNRRRAELRLLRPHAGSLSERDHVNGVLCRGYPGKHPLGLRELF